MNMYLVGVYSAQWRGVASKGPCREHFSTLGSALASPVDLGFVGIRMSERAGTSQLSSLNEAQTVPEAIRIQQGLRRGNLG